MTTTQPYILVVGATGNQGGTTARRLLTDGWSVRALTRDATSEKAQAPAEAGAEVVQGNLEDRVSLEAALQGVYGVFGVVNFGLAGVGSEGEVRQGRALADAAAAAGVQHFVFSSVGGAERKTGIPHFESKWQIEHYIRLLEVPSTVLRPVAFMDNYLFLRPLILNGTLPSFGLRSARAMQLVALTNIAAFVALAFANPEYYLGKALELAGDELTTAQTAVVFSRVIGRPVQVQDNAGEQRNEPGAMLRWFNEQGYAANIPALRKLHPEPLTLEAWARKTGWENAEPVPLPASSEGPGQTA
ncbi:hypothetical protein KSF_105270 [Reticulibacter mediterranei]|uniref:NmrA-like domain-containing protein n=1 Tax=Reticulibacter mediterranei TaxID=2778369 RepID=A0A8J3N6T2_9CHLR|nr:NmrA/HSCARG family protein [Reticulibacter mediterranei]GHP00480.1 hypothetical protein KSF_105270 [Reticulibacter mediterranei]